MSTLAGTLAWVVLAACMKSPVDDSEPSSSGGQPSLVLPGGEELDLGEVHIGCSEGQSILVENAGDADLVLDSVEVSPSMGELVVELSTAENGSLPWVVEPGGELVVAEVDFSPLAELSESATVAIDTNDPDHGQVHVNIYGIGVSWGYHEESFEAGGPQVDVLLGVDTSGSMMQEVSEMADAFGTLYATLTTSGYEFRLSAVVQEDGCVLHSSFPDPWFDAEASQDQAEQLFRTMLGLDSGYSVLGESQLGVLQAALEQAGSGECNAGFLREGAALALVGVSNEADQEAEYWKTYVEYFQSLKPDPAAVVVHAVGGNYPSGCSSKYGYASFYDGFYQASQETGGVFLSMCQDWNTIWASLVEGLTESAVVEESFRLEAEPVPETVQVWVNGIQVDEGWYYSSADQALVFSGDALPLAGETVQVSYHEAGDCP